MRKTALSVTLSPVNLAWLKARAASQDGRSLSSVLDGLLAEARSSSRVGTGAESVRGTIRISPDDAGLERADEALRALFPSRPPSGGSGA